MNYKQRNKNRSTAHRLADVIRKKTLAVHICGNCGQPGGHWIELQPPSVEATLTGQDDSQGYWSCSHSLIAPPP